MVLCLPQRCRPQPTPPCVVRVSERDVTAAGTEQAAEDGHDDVLGDGGGGDDDEDTSDVPREVARDEAAAQRGGESGERDKGRNWLHRSASRPQGLLVEVFEPPRVARAPARSRKLT